MLQSQNLLGEVHLLVYVSIVNGGVSGIHPDDLSSDDVCAYPAFMLLSIGQLYKERGVGQVSFHRYII